MILNPWIELHRPSAGRLSRRRVNAESRNELVWFRDEDDHIGLLIEIEHGVAYGQLRAFGINLRDVHIHIIELKDVGIKALSIRLTDKDKIDIFSRLCHDIAERVTHAPESESVFQIVCRRLKKWQSLFMGRTNALLTANEIQGLFAELYFLMALLDSEAVSQEEAIHGWQGPEKAPQDFILKDIAVEVKSLLGQNRGKVRISSEDQLYSDLDRLFLRVYLLAEAYGTSGGETLNSVSHRILAKLTEAHTKDTFEAKLQRAGYIDLPEYDQPQFMVKNCHTYLVSDNFPRLIRTRLPMGIQAVSYDVLLAIIEPFRVSEIGILENER
jgi:Putative  PD-(D/E)XK family member, (DUF4420)